MRIHRSFALVLCCTVFLSACASNPRQALHAEAKPHVKRIALFQVEEPKRYLAEPEQLTAGYLFYALGTLGSVIRAGIETLRYSAATERLHAALQPHQPRLADQFEVQLKSQLRAKGYQVDLINPPPKSRTGEGYDLRDIAAKYDAFLTVDMMAGFVEHDGLSSPHVQVHATLLASPTSDVLMKSPYVYTSRDIQNVPRIASSQLHALPALDDVASHPEKAVNGLREGARQVAQLLAADL
ncbi:hypothetical protein [Limnobacter sp.]|uniref:hypothetical protein n=1 Tax=Limnobacter sp. TaxID=2003368 RepID=UPI003518864B